MASKKPDGTKKKNKGEGPAKTRCGLPPKVSNHSRPNRAREVVPLGMSPKCKKVFAPQFLRLPVMRNPINGEKFPTLAVAIENISSFLEKGGTMAEVLQTSSAAARRRRGDTMVEGEVAA